MDILSHAISARNRGKKPFSAALMATVLFGAIMFYSLVILDASIHIAILLGCVISASIAVLCGSGWKEVEQGITLGIGRVLVSLVLLLLIGILAGVWIEAGVVPAMIYYGLRLLSPRFFLASVMLICSVISAALGSWGTAGTVGLAFMGLARVMGVDLPMAAGAIISGAYFGDKASPLSDTTNLAASVSEVDVFAHVRHMFPLVASAYIIALILYIWLGVCYPQAGSEQRNLLQLSERISEIFNISPMNLLPLFALIVCILLKIPPIPSICAGIFSAAVLGMVCQKSEVSDLFSAAWSGHVSANGDALIDNLLSAGGMESMLFSVSLVFCVMMFGGIMESTGLMEALTAPARTFFNGTRRLLTTTVLAGGIINMIIPEQYIAITLPGQIFSKEYDKAGLDRMKLARALGAGGAALSPLVPWNTCGVFMSGVLGVSTAEYGRYAFLNLLVPALAILIGYLPANKGGDDTSGL